MVFVQLIDKESKQPIPDGTARLTFLTSKPSIADLCDQVLAKFKNTFEARKTDASMLKASVASQLAFPGSLAFVLQPNEPRSFPCFLVSARYR